MNKEEKTTAEAEALNNAISHFNLPFVLVNKYFNDGRAKTKFFLVLAENTTVSSPTLNYDQMNHFILGMGMTKEYLK